MNRGVRQGVVRLTASISALGFLSWGVLPAVGHISNRAKEIEIHFYRDRISMIMSYEISAIPFASDLRERFDLDANGMMADDERRSLEDYVKGIALEDLRLVWEGETLSPEVVPLRSYGLTQRLPSAFPMAFRWRLDYRYPHAAAGTRQVKVEDSEPRWNTAIRCSIHLHDGIRLKSNSMGPDPRLRFDLPAQRGSISTFLVVPR